MGKTEESSIDVKDILHKETILVQFDIEVMTFENTVIRILELGFPTEAQPTQKFVKSSTRMAAI